MPTTIIRSLTAIAFYQLAILVIVAGGLYAYGQSQLAASFAYGALLMLINMTGIVWSWWRILGKKPVALTILIIVIKYALLLSSMFYCVQAGWFNALGAGLGVASFALAILGAAIHTEPKPEKEE